MVRSVFGPASPEKIAAKELEDMRLALFQAERRLRHAQMLVAYYRDVVAFLEDVHASGLEKVIDGRCAPAPRDTAQSSSGPAAVPAVPIVPVAPIAPVAA